MTIAEITALAHAYFAVRDESRAHYRTKPDPFDLDNEDHLRWQIKYDRLIRKQVNAEVPYRAACDKFFSAVETAEAA